MLGWEKSVVCFFCNHEVKPRPPNSQYFRCVECDCWNRYDKNGDLISDERAMYEETLNATAFSKRGSPRKDALPTVHTPRVFCRTCQTNQTLYLNLMSNYLPDDDDPNYDQLLAQLPQYRDSLAIRYPLVCADCSSNVEEQLKRSERLGRSNALGSWLRDNKGEGTNQNPLPTEPERRRSDRRRGRGEIWVWRARGCLWVASMVVSAACSARAISNPAYVANIPPRLRRFLPAGVFLSIFWTFWDPLWSRLLLGKPGSRKRYDWIAYQAISWVLRLITTLFIALDVVPTWLFSAHVAAEVITLILSLLTLRTPMAETSSVRLTTKRSRSLTPYPTTVIPTSSTTSFEPHSALIPAVTPQPDDILSALSLSGNPSLFRPSHAAPVFGQTSALGSTSAEVTSQFDDTRDPHAVSEDVMDWDPVTKDGQQSRMYNWMRPQVFFPPSKPTGLESLLHTTSLSTEQENDDRSQHGTGGAREPIPTIHVSRGGAVIRMRRGDAVTTYLVALLVASLASSALLLRTGSWSLHQMWNISASEPINNLSLLFQVPSNDQ